MEAWSLWGGNSEGFKNKGKWTLFLQDIPSHSERVMHFYFMILRIWRFSGLPKMPEFPAEEGPEVFGGKMMHSKDYSELENEDARNLVEGKRVVVVVFQKSALDIAYEVCFRLVEDAAS